MHGHNKARKGKGRDENLKSMVSKMIDKKTMGNRFMRDWKKRHLAPLTPKRRIDMAKKITAPTIQPIIGRDPGAGNEKIRIDKAYGVIQSAVSIPRDIGKAGMGMKSAGSHAKIVSVNGHTYAVGEGAGDRGRLKSSMDFSSFASPERNALMYAALAQVFDQLEITELKGAKMVIGLPVPLLEDMQQAEAVIASLKGLYGDHSFEVEGKPYHVEIVTIEALAQPVGAYLDWLYDDNIQPRAGASKAEVMVIDGGMNTLDVYALKAGRVLNTFVGGAETGVRRLLELLATNGHSIFELDEDLRSGRLKVESGALNSYLNEVLSALKTATDLKDYRRFDTVILTGGAFSGKVLGEKIKTALIQKGANPTLPANPITANVGGLWKYGMKKWATPQ